MASPPRATDEPDDLGPPSTLGPVANLSGARYAFKTLLGVGGMGEVRLCRDAVIGRDVALKVAKVRGADASAEGVERFVREARVQGQLEHPSVVPVYDLGESPEGPFFTMKRVRGVTLGDIVAKLKAGDPEFAERYSRRRLLTAFTSVCLAIDFAHARGVIHRDVKPGNVMLGSYGEVHVLDWGLAKLRGSEDVARPAEPIDDVTPSYDQTQHGQLLGTPGYIAPEQVQGELDKVDARTDVYSLGAILFEILALEPLHARPNIGALLIATLKGASDARPSARAPDRDVPPELDAICVRATAVEPDDRFPSARALCDDVERYLDGDRDLQRRKELAEEHAAAAKKALADATDTPAAERAARVAAMRSVTRALALDPQHAGAMATLAKLLVEVPDQLPPEAEAEMRVRDEQTRRQAARATAIRYATWSAFIPFVIAMGVRDWTAGLSAIACLAASTLLALWTHKREGLGPHALLWLLVPSSLALGWMTTLFGPFILVPGLAATNTLFQTMHAERRTRRLMLALGVLTVVVPALLEVFQVTARSYDIAVDEILVHPRMASFSTWPTAFVLFVSSVLVVLTPTLLVGRLRDALASAERRLFLHSWHLKQLVPEEALLGGSAAPRPARRSQT